MTSPFLTALGNAESEGMSSSLSGSGLGQVLYALPAASSKSRPGDRFRCASVVSNTWSFNKGLSKVFGYNPDNAVAGALLGNSAASISDAITDWSWRKGLSAEVNSVPKVSLTALGVKAAGKLPTNHSAFTMAQNSAGTWFATASQRQSGQAEGGIGSTTSITFPLLPRLRKARSTCSTSSTLAHS